MGRLRKGERLGDRWSLDELLGEGGAGTVYAATGPGGMRGAAKLLHPTLAAVPAVRQRFIREGYVANKIDHTGVVRVFEDGVTDDGTPYLLMELLDGETVEARWERKGGRLPVHEVLWITEQTLKVLDVAHQKGIVHRDIKPENLFITRDRKLKVLDFGIARIDDVTLANGENTGAGTILGTIAFMPPEQARGATEQIGPRADLWAVGATMFLLLTGKTVRTDQNILAALAEASTEPVPSLATLAPELPAEMVELVDHALDLDIDVRWSTATTMRKAVRLVWNHLQRQSARATERPGPKQPVDEDDDEISQPFFDFESASSIDPPPMSVDPRQAERDIVSAVVEIPRASRVPNVASLDPDARIDPEPVDVAAIEKREAQEKARIAKKQEALARARTETKPTKRVKAPEPKPVPPALIAALAVALAVIVFLLLTRR